MPDYSNLDTQELDELASFGLLNIIGLLIDLDVERDEFQPHLDIINSAIAELALRAKQAEPA